MTGELYASVGVHFPDKVSSGAPPTTSESGATERPLSARGSHERVWGCLRCGVVTTAPNGRGWCPDCVEVEAMYRQLERQRAYYALHKERILAQHRARKAA